MADRLLIGVLGNRNSGKSTTWNTLFGATVRTGRHSRPLALRLGECVEVFLASGSPEERELYVGDIVGETNARIILCSLQYRKGVASSFGYFIENGFFIYLQWLNPGYSDPGENFDRLGIVNQILSVPSVVSMRDGRADPAARIQEIREFIYGWAVPRGLVFAC
ncbi:MAG: hypothetical protein ACREE4_16185 [Stellaceae bacterium]